MDVHVPVLIFGILRAEVQIEEVGRVERQTLQWQVRRVGGRSPIVCFVRATIFTGKSVHDT